MSSPEPSQIDVRQLARHHERLRRMVWALVGDEHRAEDVVQDVWVRALERQQIGPRSPRAWLKTVTRRLASNERRSQRRRSEREREAAQQESLPSSDEIAERVEIEARVVHVLDGLEEPHRTVLRDRYLGELTPTELARRDGISLNTVKSRLSRARAAMRDQLEDHGLGGDVHWSVAAAPLLTLRGPGGPGGPGAGVSLPGPSTLPISPPVTPAPTPSLTGPATAATTSPLIGAALLGGALVMKKALVLVAAIAFAAAAWKLTADGPAALPAPTSTGTAPPNSAAAELEGEGSQVAILTGERLAVAVSDGSPARPSAEALAAWRIVGRARAARGNVGVSGIPFDIGMYAGYAPVGELLWQGQVVSGADGLLEAALPDPDQTVTITVDSGNDERRFVETPRPMLVVAGDAPPKFDAFVYRIDGLVEGTVRDSAGNPVQGCAVEGMLGTARSGVNGRYQMAIATAAGEAIAATAPGYGGDMRRLEGLEAGAAVTLDFTLGEAVRIEGVVRGAGGTAIAGAQVECSGRFQGQTVTDGAGRYSLESVCYLPGESVWLSADADGFGPSVLGLELEVDRREYEQDLELVRGVPAAGRITDDSGAPVPGAKVWIGPHRGAHGNGTTLSDDDGRFTFDCVAPGPMNVGATREGFAPAAAAITVDSGRGAENITLRFPPARNLRGIAVGPDGAAIHGAVVTAQQNYRYVGGSASSDESGAFELSNLPQGALTLLATATGYARRTVDVSTDDSAAPVVITLAQAGGIAGRAVNAATGEPLKEFTVRLVFPSDPKLQPRVEGFNSKWSQPGLTFRDEAGRWSTGEFDKFLLGAWIGVEIQASGYAPATQMVQVLANETESGLVHRLVRPVTVELVASVRGSGEPVAGATVLATTRVQPTEEDRRWQGATDEAGTAVLEDVSPGSLFVILTRPAGPSLRLGPFEVPPAPSRSILAIEVPAAHAVEITLLDASGKPLPDRPVELSGTMEGAGYISLAGITNKDGVCRIEGMPAGRWQVDRTIRKGTRTYPDLSAQVTVLEGELVTHFELRPPGTTVVHGTVDADGTIPMGSHVTALARDGSIHHGAFIDEGNFELNGLAPGKYALTLSYWEDLSGAMMTGHAELEVHPGDKELNASLRMQPE